MGAQSCHDLSQAGVGLLRVDSDADRAKENWTGRTAVPADITRVVLFLASDLARYAMATP